MNLRIIINSLIIIFIFHFFLINCDISIDIGKKKINNDPVGYINQKSHYELFTNSDVEQKINATSNTDKFRQNLLNYVKTSQGTINAPATKLDNDKNEISAYNTYLSNTSNPNFNSNVADISKFFNKNDEPIYDNMSENQLNTLEIKNNYTYKNEQLSPIHSTVDNISNIPGNVDNNNAKPQIWNYKNELPMNGGKIENSSIVGFDSLDSHYAMYDSNNSNVQKCDVDNPFSATDVQDLRKGKYSG